MVVGGGPVSVCPIRQLANIFRVVAADVDIQKDHVSVYVLFAEQTLQMRFDGDESLGEPGLLLPSIERHIEH